MKIELKEPFKYVLVDFATCEEVEHTLPAGSVLDAIFVNDEFISKLKDEWEIGFFGSLKGYYYVDCTENGLCDYETVYLQDHELDIFAFKQEEIEVIE